jgi:hypothetical protein
MVMGAGRTCHRNSYSIVCPEIPETAFGKRLSYKDATA